MKQVLKEQAQKYIPQILAGAIGFLALKIWNLLIDPMLPEIYKTIDTKSALMLFLLSFVLNLAFLYLIIISIKKENKNKLPEPTIYYGIYFNWKFDPLCPSCKAPLQIESLPINKQIVQKPKLTCPNGHYDRIPTNDIGEELNIASIRSSLIKDHFNIND